MQNQLLLQHSLHWQVRTELHLRYCSRVQCLQTGRRAQKLVFFQVSGQGLGGLHLLKGRQLHRRILTRRTLRFSFHKCGQ